MEKKPQLIAKEQEVAQLQQLFEENQAVILSDYRGITVDKDVKLRAKLREAGVEYRVAKNTLIKIAANKFGIDCLDKFLEGPTAISFAKDPVAGAKIIGDFIRENKVTAFKAGLLDGKFLEPKEIDSLAKLPSREVLLSQVASCFSAPMAAFARALNAYAEQAASGEPAAKVLDDGAPAPAEEAAPAEAPAEEAAEEAAPAEAPAEEAAPAEDQQ